MIKKILSQFLIVVFIALMFSGCSRPQLKLYDTSGELIASAKKLSDFEGLAERAYLEAAVSEAAEILAGIKGCKTKEAKELLLSGEYSIYTAFDSKINQAIVEVYEQTAIDFDLGGAIVDSKGMLVAAFCGFFDDENWQNLISEPITPYAALAPISVYLPAIENGSAHWSSAFIDSSYKLDEQWPENSNEKYSGERMIVCDALKQSVNTVAVKCLSKSGVENSLDFLSQKLGIQLEAEQKDLKKGGANEVIGNLALGELENGVSLKELAGYYGVFNSAGFYVKPAAVVKICDSSGKPVYEHTSEQKQIVSSSSADIMNMMLKRAVNVGGNAENAYLKGVEVAGMCGSGDNGGVFAGVTPDYSFAFAAMGNASGDTAAKSFALVADKLYSKNNQLASEFTLHTQLKQMIYCTDSGGLISSGCSTIDSGYYNVANIPEKCDQH